MPYEFRLIDTIPATPQKIYAAWLDSVAHSAMTGAAAVMSDEVGANVSAWDGYITGRNLELVSGKCIVQSWRTSRFTDEHEDSVITVLLEATDGGTLLTLVHSNVPDDQRSYEQGGWQENYFVPMKAYFSTGRKPAAMRPPARDAKKKAKKATARKPPVKAKRAAAAKKAAPRARSAKKASTRKTPGRRSTPAKRAPARGRKR